MTEVLAIFSAVPAIAQLVEQSFRSFSDLRRAYYRQKDFAAVLSRHETELLSIETILRVIEEETDLQTAGMAAELVRFKAVQTRLDKWLSKMDPKSRSKVGQITRQVTKGDADEKKLAVIMDDLGHVKTSMLLCIQVANVGVVRNMEKQYFADAKTIARIDSRLKEALEDYEGLRIAQLLKDRRPSNDGKVLLTPDDVRSLGSDHSGEDSGDETLVDSESDEMSLSKKERIIISNMALHESLQINGALGEDIWKDYQRLEIRDNTAKDTAVQINYGMNLDAFKIAMSAHAENLRAASGHKGGNRRPSARSKKYAVD